MNIGSPPARDQYWLCYKSDQERTHKRLHLEDAVYSYLLRKEAWKKTKDPKVKKMLKSISSLAGVAEEFGVCNQTLFNYKQRMNLEGRT
jgi:hypothetical protein